MRNPRECCEHSGGAAELDQEPDMQQRNCQVCDAQLSGRQRKYCSRECNIQATTAARDSTYFASYREANAEKVAAARRARRVLRTCVVCGNTWRTARRDAKLCSSECRAAYQTGKPRDVAKRVCQLPSDHPVRALMRDQRVALYQQKSPLRVAVETEDWPTVLELVRQRSTSNEAGCWIWQGRFNDGYPFVRVGRRQLAVHRLVVEAKYQAPLGSQAAHHMCADTACVRPDHLQPVTARENTAEMLARTYYERRIAELEAALAATVPDHPLLQEIGVASA